MIRLKDVSLWRILFFRFCSALERVAEEISLGKNRCRSEYILLGVRMVKNSNANGVVLVTVIKCSQLGFICLKDSGI